MYKLDFLNFLNILKFFKLIFFDYYVIILLIFTDIYCRSGYQFLVMYSNSQE